jgi:hypothetical protein
MTARDRKSSVMIIEYIKVTGMACRMPRKFRIHPKPLVRFNFAEIDRCMVQNFADQDT